MDEFTLNNFNAHSNSFYYLCLSAVTVACLHTLLGPDHYLPFVAMARARSWTERKTLIITLLCGLGHIAGSVVLGLVGIALGVGLFSLNALESLRGQLAGWMLIAFGLTYTVWGLRRAFRNKPHTHWHAHPDGTVHTHEHTHTREHLHVHQQATPERDPDPQNNLPPSGQETLTPWILFTVFLFGPCEPLVPLLFYASVTNSWKSVLALTLLYGLATLLTMLVMVTVLLKVANRTQTATVNRFPRSRRFGHALAGVVILFCGAAVQLGW